MIKYDNSKYFRIIFNLRGSVLSKTLAPAAVSCLMGLGMAILRKSGKADEWIPGGDSEGKYLMNTFTISVAVTALGYLLVVRTNMALNRWMEAIEHVMTMMSKWTDACKEVNGFFTGKKDTKERQERILMFRVRFAHWLSLLSALAFASFRGREIDNLDDINIKVILPTPFSSNKKRQNFGRSRNRAPSRSTSSELLPRPVGASTESLPKMSANSVISRATLRETLKVGASGGTQDLGGTTETRRAEMQDMNIGVLSMPSVDEVERLDQTEDKVNMVLLWILQGLMLEVRAGTLDIPPPILTRVLQELSDGMLGFNQAHKIASTPFPFPIAQVVTVALFLLDIYLPFAIDNFTQNVVLTPILSFILPMCYHGLNETSIELEEPFGIDWNDVDIEDLNRAFLRTLIDVLRLPPRPPYPKNWPEDTSFQFERQVRNGFSRGLNYVLTEESNHLQWDAMRLDAERDRRDALQTCLLLEREATAATPEPPSRTSDDLPRKEATWEEESHNEEIAGTALRDVVLSPNAGKDSVGWCCTTPREIGHAIHVEPITGAEIPGS